MTVGEVKKQSSCKLRINLSHTLEGNKIKPTSTHTDTNKHTAAKPIYYNRRASKLVKLKSQKKIQPQLENQLSHTLESYKTKTTKQHTSILNILQQKQNIIHHIRNTTSESRKLDSENEKRRFGRATLLKKGTRKILS